MVNVKLPAADGVPEIRPLPSVSPGGSLSPDLTEKFTGRMPPLVVISALNGTPALAAGRLDVVIERGSEVMRTLAFVVADLRLASVTFTVKSNVPVFSGSPVISPLVALIVIPLGSEPRMLQASGGTPPVAFGAIFNGSLYFASTGAMSAIARS